MVLLALLLGSCGDVRGNEGGNTLATVRAIFMSAAGSHTCVLLNNNALKCWGANNKGQLGLGDTQNRGDAPNEMGDSLPAIDLGANRTVVLTAAGHAHTCALFDDGSVKCWGDNAYGELGLGNTANRGDDPGEMGDHLPAVDLGAGRTAVALAAGFDHTCALLDNGLVKCWGWNYYGQLGQGDTASLGVNPGEMGDNLPAIDLGAGRTAVSIVAGDLHSCAILDNGFVKCWGANAYGRLGQGDQVNRGDDPGEMGDNLPAIDLGAGRTAVKLAAGWGHTCALLDNGAVKCWGFNLFGQLGQGDTAPRGDDPGEMGDNLLAVDLGTNRTAVAIAAGIYHSCARLDDSTVKCWGYNFSGQLGQGDVVDRGDGPGEMGNNLPAIDLGNSKTVWIAAGTAHTCVLLNSHTAKCWGINFSGQLGQGDVEDRGDNPGEMGKNLPPIDLGTM
jgi:alpha-tubulin suppressor-like RCC1 family protein